MTDLRDLLPLKPMVFHLLVELLDGPQHGWSLLRAVEDRTGVRVLPGHLYRQLDAMLESGFIEAIPMSESLRTRSTHVGGAVPKRLFRLTALGRRVARAEAVRLEAMMADARVRRLLPDRRRT